MRLHSIRVPRDLIFYVPPNTVRLTARSRFGVMLIFRFYPLSPTPPTTSILGWIRHLEMCFTYPGYLGLSNESWSDKI